MQRKLSNRVSMSFLRMSRIHHTTDYYYPPNNELFKILVLPEGKPFVTDNYGNEFEIDWTSDEDVYSTGLCAINFKNEMLIFG